MSELKQVLEQAEIAADESIEATERAVLAAEEVPQTADDLLSMCEISACLRVEAEVDSYALGKAALDFDNVIRKRLARNAAVAISEKMELTHDRTELTHDRTEQEVFGSRMIHVYGGQVYVFTRDELRELVDDAIRAGRLTADL